MRKFAIHVALAALLLAVSVAQASQFGGGYFGAKMGANTSSATDATGTEVVPVHRAIAFFMQGGYLQGGYNLDISPVVIGVGAYADWNGYAKHADGTAYGSRSYGLDAKLGVPLGDWLLYAKYGRGNNTATDDLSFVAQSSPNSALGFEYKLSPHWGTIGEYKLNKFSSRDGSVTIHNKTISFGLNYYFDEPPKPAPPPEPASEPELIPIEQAPVISFAAPVSEAWKIFMEDKPVRIEDSDFVAGSANLRLVSGTRLLNEVVDFIKDHPDSALEVTGYTDSTGAEKQNRQLSLARANSIKKYLVSKGISADRITTKGEGSANPVGDNKTKEGRALNRRVEIRSVVRQVKKAPEQVKKAPEQVKEAPVTE